MDYLIQWNVNGSRLDIQITIWGTIVWKVLYKFHSTLSIFLVKLSTFASTLNSSSHSSIEFCPSWINFLDPHPTAVGFVAAPLHYVLKFSSHFIFLMSVFVWFQLLLLWAAHPEEPRGVNGTAAPNATSIAAPRRSLTYGKRFLLQTKHLFAQTFFSPNQTTTATHIILLSLIRLFYVTMARVQLPDLILHWARIQSIPFITGPTS